MAARQQSSNTFVNMSRLIVENKDGCGLVKEVLQYSSSSILTPNGDGANDYWNLKGLNGSIYKNAKIFIFDRYGKLKQLNPYGVGWDGNYNGNSLPSDDYWYTIT
jgi:gliding motility-associated-like protein